MTSFFFNHEQGTAMSYQQITSEQRYIIAAYLRDGISPTSIAFRLGKHKSTIYREIKRNGSKDGSYRAEHACGHARVTKKNGRKRTFFTQAQWDMVDRKLREDWSPEQIALVFRLWGIMVICHETIYLHIWKDMKSGGDLWIHLRQSQKRRRKRYKSRDSRGVLGGKRELASRPKEATERSEKGHFEIDLVHGHNHSDCILTLVDRQTRFLIILKLKNKTNAEVEKHLVPIIKKFQIKTITADNGTEWHGFRDIESKTGVVFYFAEPYHSWERGTNENTNGLIRQYLPKRMSMHGLTQAQCEIIAQRLNRRPRKVLDLYSPETCYLGIPIMSHF
jgi:IS30 family transposase